MRHVAFGRFGECLRGQIFFGNRLPVVRHAENEKLAAHRQLVLGLVEPDFGTVGYPAVGVYNFAFVSAVGLQFEPPDEFQAADKRISVYALGALLGVGDGFGGFARRLVVNQNHMGAIFARGLFEKPRDALGLAGVGVGDNPKSANRIVGEKRGG